MVLPGIGHIPLTLDARALEKEIEVVGRLQAKVGA
jgi:hypothetical protein